MSTFKEEMERAMREAEKDGDRTKDLSKDLSKDLEKGTKFNHDKFGRIDAEEKRRFDIEEAKKQALAEIEAKFNS